MTIAGKDNGEIKPIKWNVNARGKGKDWGNSVFSAGAAILSDQFWEERS